MDESWHCFLLFHNDYNLGMKNVTELLGSGQRTKRGREKKNRKKAVGTCDCERKRDREKKRERRGGGGGGRIKR